MVYRLCWRKYRVCLWWPENTVFSGETIGKCGLLGWWQTEHLRHFIALEAKVLPRLAQMTELIPARTSMQYRTRPECKWYDCVHGLMCVHQHNRRQMRPSEAWYNQFAQPKEVYQNYCSSSKAPQNRHKWQRLGGRGVPLPSIYCLASVMLFDSSLLSLSPR
jgi:hypothetical protein